MIILILLFDGTLVKEKYELSREMSVYECLLYADDHREAIATYIEFDDAMKDEAKSMGFILVTYEQGYKDDPNKNVVCMSAHALRNAGYYTLADETAEALKCIIKR